MARKLRKTIGVQERREQEYAVDYDALIQAYNAQFPRMCLAILGVGVLLFISLGAFFYLTGLWNAIP